MSFTRGASYNHLNFSIPAVKRERRAMSPPCDDLPGPDEGQYIISTNGLTKTFNGHPIIDHLTFAIPQGVIFGYIGPSGSGKTTTLRLLTGIYRPTEGSALVLGNQPSCFRRADREKIGYMTQHFVLYPTLTVWENLNFAASLYGYSPFRRKRLEALLEFVELSEHRHKLASHLSEGMKKRLSLAATLIHKPALLFLDEPTAGIDPILRRKIWDYFKELQAENYSLFVTTQYVGEAAYCDLVGVMMEGRLLAVDTPQELRRRAFGGDVIDLRVREPLDYAARHALSQLEFVRPPLRSEGENDLQIVVDEAGTAMPGLIEWCQAHQLTIESVEQYFPPFDDVFVKFVQGAQNQ